MPGQSALQKTSPRRPLSAAFGAAMAAFTAAPKPLGTSVDLTNLATYYVDSVGGSNANNGTTPTTPKQTLAGLPTLVAGNTVALKCGSEFREGMPLGVSGAAGQQIVWGQYGLGTRPKVKGSKDYGTTLVWTAVGSGVYSAPAASLPGANTNMVYVDEVIPLRKYASLAALQAGYAGGFFADSTNSILYVWLSDGSNPTGRRIEVNGVVAAPVNLSQGYVTIQDIAFMHGYANTTNQSVSTIPGVIIRRCQVGPHFGTGMYVGSPGMIFEDNFVTTCWDGYEYPSSQGAGIVSGTANTLGAQIRRNWITNCRNGMTIQGATAGLDIYRNFLYLNHVNGIDIFTPSGSKKIRVVNNTIWHRPTGPTPAGHGIDTQSTGTGLWSVNNIVITDFAADPTNTEVYTLASGSAGDTFEDYNLGWVLPGSTAYYGKVQNTTYGTAAAYWAAVQAAYGASNDAHSLNADPLLANLTALDARPLPGSAAIGVGMVVPGIAELTPAGAAPNLGAF